MKIRNSFVILCSSVFAMSLVLSGCSNKSSSKGDEPSDTNVSAWTITFNSQGGSAVASQQVADGGKATKPANPSRSGYNFDGWFKDSYATTSFSFATEIHADWTLYAGWTLVKPQPDPVPDPDPEPVTVADYFFKINEKYYGLVENSAFTPTPGSTVLKEYYANIGAVNGGESFSFTNASKETITNIGSDPEDATNKNNYTGNATDGFAIRNAATTASVYLKTYEDGYSFWITGYANSEIEESPYYVNVGSTKVDLNKIGTDETDGPTTVGKYTGSITVSGGETLEFHGADGVIRPGADAGNNNVNGSWEDGYTVRNAAEADIYLKEYEDGGYSFWITGYDDGTPVVTSTYFVKIGSAAKVELVPNTEATLLDGQTGEYMAHIASVTKDDAVVFYDGDSAFTSAIGPDTGKNNGVKTGEFSFAIHNDAENIDVYFKTWETGYSFWITGYETPAGSITYQGTNLPDWITNNGCVVFAWAWNNGVEGHWVECVVEGSSLSFIQEEEIDNFLLVRCVAGTTQPDWALHDPSNNSGRIYNQTDDIACSSGTYSYNCSTWKEYH